MDAYKEETIRLLNSFMALYPENPLCDDAAFSMANASLDLKQYDAVVNLSGKFKERFPKSEFASGTTYAGCRSYRRLGH